MSGAAATVPTRLLNPAEVLLLLRDFYVRELGMNPDEAAARVRPDTRLVDLPNLDEIDYGLLVWYAGLRVRDVAATRFDAESLVADLCHDWAGRIEVPAILPVRVLDRLDVTAGAFLTVRRVLADAGADVSGVAPSTPLGDYLYEHPGVFRATLARMAPGRLPPLRMTNRRLGRRLIGVFLAVLGLALAWLVNKAAPAVAAVIAGVAIKLGVVDLLLIPLAGRRRNWSVDFGGLYDFRDLVDAMLGRPLRCRRVAAA